MTTSTIPDDPQNINYPRTLTTGVQDISALLPLLGTEQCEINTTSSLRKGFLHTAMTPLSIFGSLGLANAGFKTLLASIEFGSVNGAQLIASAGFEPKGEDLALVTLDADSNEPRAVKEFGKMIERLVITAKDRRVTVELHKDTWKWNYWMVVVTALLSIIGLVPYIPLNVSSAQRLPYSTRWTYPALRVFGSFLTAISIPLILQHRTLSILRKHFASTPSESPVITIDTPSESPVITIDTPSESPVITIEIKDPKLEPTVQSDRDHSPELQKPLATPSESPVITNEVKGPPEPTVQSDHDHSPENHRTQGNTSLYPPSGSPALGPHPSATPQDGPTSASNSAICNAHTVRWFLLLCGIFLTMVGYVGCFTVVQSNNSLVDVILWLALEVILSIARITVWCINPKADDVPGLCISVSVDGTPPPPVSDTADTFHHTIPLQRPKEFLSDIAPYIPTFTTPPEVTGHDLYYTLARKSIDKDGTNPRDFSSYALLVTIVDPYTNFGWVASKGWCGPCCGGKPSGHNCFLEVQYHGREGITTNPKTQTVTAPIPQNSAQEEKWDPIKPSDLPFGEKTLQALKTHYESLYEGLKDIFPLTPSYHVVLCSWRLKEVGGRQSIKQNLSGSDPQIQQCLDLEGRYFREFRRLEGRVHKLIMARREWLSLYFKVLNNTAEASLKERIANNSSHSTQDAYTLQALITVEYALLRHVIEQENQRWHDLLRSRLDVLSKDSSRTWTGRKVRWTDLFTSNWDATKEKATQDMWNRPNLGAALAPEELQEIEKEVPSLIHECHSNQLLQFKDSKSISALLVYLFEKLFTGNEEGKRRFDDWRAGMERRIQSEWSYSKSYSDSSNSESKHPNELPDPSMYLWGHLPPLPPVSIPEGFRDASQERAVVISHNPAKWCRFDSRAFIKNSETIRKVFTQQPQVSFLSIPLDTSRRSELVAAQECIFDAISTAGLPSIKPSIENVHFSDQPDATDRYLFRKFSSANAALSMNRARHEGQTCIDIIGMKIIASGNHFLGDEITPLSSSSRVVVTFHGPAEDVVLQLRIVCKSTSAKAHLRFDEFPQFKPLVGEANRMTHKTLEIVAKDMVKNDGAPPGLIFEPKQQNTLTVSLQPSQDPNTTQDIEKPFRDGALTIRDIELFEEKENGLLVRYRSMD